MVSGVGSDRAADVPMFDTGERPETHWVDDVERGVHVQRVVTVDRRAANEFKGPDIAVGLDVR